MLAALLLGGLTPIAVSGCTPPEAPSTPTPTALFASEGEAFAAAEEVYRDYNEALNNVDLDDPKSFEPLFALAEGEFEAADRKTLSRLHAEHYQFVGDMVITQFAGEHATKDFSVVEAAVCIDVSKSDVIDESGRSVVSPSRPRMNALHVTFVLDERKLLISKAERDEGIQCA